MKEFLRNHGVFRSWDDYDNYILAMETVNSEILAFAESFQRKAFEEYKKTFNLTDLSLEFLSIFAFLLFHFASSPFLPLFYLLSDFLWCSLV